MLGDVRDSQIDLTVTLVSWNTNALLRACLRSLLANINGCRVEVHVVDNASTDGSPEMVRAEFPDVRLIENTKNVGFALANNLSWRESRGRYWMLLNPDTIVRPGAFAALVRFMDARPRAGSARRLRLRPDAGRPLAHRRDGGAHRGAAEDRQRVCQS